MRSLGEDGAALPVKLEADGSLTVEDETVGHLDGFRFVVDPSAGAADRKMLLAAGEKALPGLLASRAQWLIDEGLGELSIANGAINWGKHSLAKITIPDDFGAPRLQLAREISMLADAPRQALENGLSKWLEGQLEPLAPMRKLAEAARDPEVGSEARALIHTLVASGGMVSREKAGLEHLPKDLRPILRKLGVTFGALDIYVFALLKPAPRKLLYSLGLDKRGLQEAMLPVIPGGKRLPAGYRPAGEQAIRIDLAEKIIRAAFEARAKLGADKPGAKFFLDPALAISIGLEEENFRRLLGGAGFRFQKAPDLAEGAFGPPAPDSCHWRPRRKNDRRHGKPNNPNAKGKRFGGKRKGQKPANEPARGSGAFDALAELIR